VIAQPGQTITAYFYV